MTVDAPANPLIALRVDSTTAYTGAGLIEDVHDLISAYESGSWIDATIGGVATSMDLLGACTDPLGTVASWGVSWLIEHVKPLSDALDWLAGDPDQITAYANTWRNIADAVHASSEEFRHAVSTDLADWAGTSAEAYRSHADAHQQALGGIAKAADGIGMIVEGAGLLVALVRGFVRDLIAEFVSILAVRLPEWLAEEALTLGIATPWVAAQVSSLVAKWVAKIARLLHGLSASLRRLVPILHRLGDVMNSLKSLQRALRRQTTSLTPPTQATPTYSLDGHLPTFADYSPKAPTLAATTDTSSGLTRVDASLTHTSAGGAYAPDVGADGHHSIGPSNLVGATLDADPLYPAANRSVDVAAITPEPVWRTSNEPLWRHDDRPPSEIFANGFEPWDPSNTDLAGFVRRDEASAFVSSTRNEALVWGSQYRYEIWAPGGIEVNRTLGEVVFPREAEIAFPGGISPRFISGAHRIGWDGLPIPGSWVPNPFFNPT
jgi:uncharacterized protein YukE